MTSPGLTPGGRLLRGRVVVLGLARRRALGWLRGRAGRLVVVPGELEHAEADHQQRHHASRPRRQARPVLERPAALPRAAAAGPALLVGRQDRPCEARPARRRGSGRRARRAEAAAAAGARRRCCVAACPRTVVGLLAVQSSSSWKSSGSGRRGSGSVVSESSPSSLGFVVPSCVRRRHPLVVLVLLVRAPPAAPGGGWISRVLRARPRARRCRSAARGAPLCLGVCVAAVPSAGRLSARQSRGPGGPPVRGRRRGRRGRAAGGRRAGGSAGAAGRAAGLPRAGRRRRLGLGTGGCGHGWGWATTRCCGALGLDHALGRPAGPLAQALDVTRLREVERRQHGEPDDGREPGVGADLLDDLHEKRVSEP